MIEDSTTLGFHSQPQRSGQAEGTDVSSMLFYIYGLRELASTFLAYK